MLRRSSIDRNQWFLHSWQNRLQTALLLVFLGSYLLLLGWMIWGSAAAIWLLVIGGALLLMPAGSAQLLMKLYGAKPLSSWQAPQTYQMIHQLAQRAELGKPPQLYCLPMRQPNAMAAGSRAEPIIAVSEGLLGLLSQRELAGVLAHEISHLRNDDLRFMRLADLASRLTNSLSLFGQILLLLNLPLLLFSDQSINWLLVLMLILAPQVSTLAQLGLSRVREYNADLGAAALTEDPEGLASALQKIERTSGGLLQRLIPGSSLPHWLRTHPPTRERVGRLLELTTGCRKRPLARHGQIFRANIYPEPVRGIPLPTGRILPDILQRAPGRGSKPVYRNRGCYGC